MGQPTRLTPTGDFKLYRRNLPHLELPGSVYFITFTTKGELSLPDKAKDIVFDSIKFHTGKKYELHSCVVMETHAHTILRPLYTQAGSSMLSAVEIPRNNSTLFSLAQITHSLKSYSANRIQETCQIQGSVWVNESYDRVIRDDNDYQEKMNYIIYNPVKAGFVKNPEEYRWLYVCVPFK